MGALEGEFIDGKYHGRCDFCGKDTTWKRQDGKHCSDACSAKARRAKKRNAGTTRATIGRVLDAFRVEANVSMDDGGVWTGEFKIVPA